MQTTWVPVCLPYRADIVLSETIAPILREGSGACVIRDFPLEPEDRALLALSQALGTPLAEDRNLNAGMVCLVEIEQEPKVPAYANTPYEFPCHTDCAELPIPPDTVILLCERPAETGGESYLAPLEQVWEQLPPSDRELLFQTAFPFREQLFPILAYRDKKRWVRYNRVMLEITRRLHDRPPDQYFEVMNRFDEVLAASRQVFRLEARDCLILNNYRLLHGRAKFPPDSPRRLRRIRLNLAEQ